MEFFYLLIVRLSKKFYYGKISVVARIIILKITNRQQSWNHLKTINTNDTTYISIVYERDDIYEKNNLCDW